VSQQCVRVGYGGSGRVAASLVDSCELLYLHIWFVKYLDGDMEIIKNFEKYDKRFGLPVDVALDNKGERGEESIDILNKNHHSDLPILDIGLETIVESTIQYR
jgi:glyceraldehyde-3-phosphate dehydrogenase/erythrose-4-phosphate dehydrogenase